MTRKIKPLLVLCAFLLSMCRSYDQNGTVASTNGLSCQNYTEYGFFKRSQRATCFYVCPNGTVAQPDIPENFSESSSLYTATKKDLDAQFCSVTAQSTATQQIASTSAPATALITATESTVENATVTATLVTTAQASPVAGITATIESQSALLTGDVTMCDQTTDLISFRIINPAPDLTDKLVTVQVSEQETSCDVNPVNTSLLTCALPSPISFPAQVVVSLDGAVVNDFVYDGIGCILVDTPIP